MKFRHLAAFLAVLLPGAVCTALFGQTLTQDQLKASNEFRRGVQAFNRFSFNEAILSFEKALSYKNGDGLILDWLGRSYYRSGVEDTALRQWQSAFSAYSPASAEGTLLRGRLETVRNRRSLLPQLDGNARYAEAGRYPNKNGAVVLFRQPTSLLPNPDGSVWVVAYGSNELLRIDPNGLIRARVRGPLNGFDRPYDIARSPDGKLYVSEYKGNRVSVLDASGNWKSYIGAAGRGDGQFIGPQNLCVDQDGYVYVVDFGNHRVVKFGPDGAFLLSFGAKRDGFDGFGMPTGIAAVGEEVYVVDASAKRIARFDRSGNFLDYFAEGAFKDPEALRPLSDGTLLAADTGRVVLVDPRDGTSRELGGPGEGKARILCAAADMNGSLLAADYLAEEVTVMTRMDDLAAGLFVQIERVTADRFPEVDVEVRVEDRRRRPVVGLDSRNFLITEGGRRVNAQAFVGASYASASADLALLIERSPATKGAVDAIADAVRDAGASGDRIVSVVSAGEQPAKERTGSPSALDAAARSSASAYSAKWKFDAALRLSATDLLAGEKKRGVVFIGSGKLGDKAFGRYSAAELAAYLANNGIKFYAALLGDQAPSKELSFLCEQTGGALVPIYRPEGIAPLLASLRDSASASYLLKYTSTLPTDYGRAYLPVEAQAYLLIRSGRDALGYFSPLK